MTKSDLICGTNGLLSVEICTKSSVESVGVREAVLAWLRDQLSSSKRKDLSCLVFNQAIRNLPAELARKVEYVLLYAPGGCQQSPSMSTDGTVSFKVITHSLSSNVSKMFHDVWIESDEQDSLGDCTMPSVVDPPASNIVDLPARTLDGIWESLIYDPSLREDLLRSLVNYVSLSRAAFHEMTAADRAHRLLSNAMVLLWGPPGTGKTSLSKALAQRLSVRLKPVFARSKLVELPSYSMGSRYYSESAKMVWRHFNQLATMIREEPDTLVCILIDEVESLCPSRDPGIGSQEPLDGQRAVNALLTAVDQLRQYSNFLVFCTRNLLQAMDTAFIDRIDFKLEVPRPSATACAEILRRGYLDIPTGHLGPARGVPIQSRHTETMLTADGRPIAFEDFLFRRVPGPHFRASGDRAHAFAYLRAVVAEQLLVLPETVQLCLGPAAAAAHPAVRLRRLARRCPALSARALRRLPLLSLVQRGLHDNWPCPLDEALDGLDRLVDQELILLERTAAAGRKADPLSSAQPGGPFLASDEANITKHTGMTAG